MKIINILFSIIFLSGINCFFAGNLGAMEVKEKEESSNVPTLVEKALEKISSKEWLEKISLSQPIPNIIKSLDTLSLPYLARKIKDKIIEKYQKILEPIFKPKVRTLKGHKSLIRCFAVLPNGRIVSGSLDKTIKIWDSNTYKLLKTLEGHKYNVNSLAVFPDGKRLISISDNAEDPVEIKIWDSNTGNCLKTFEIKMYAVGSVGIFPDGKRFIIGSYFSNGGIKILNSNTGNCLKDFPELEANTFAFFPDKKRFISGSYANEIRIWDSETYKCLKTLKGHTAAFLNKGKRFVVGGENGIITIYNSKTYEILSKLIPSFLCPAIGPLAVLPDGQIVSSEFYGTIKIWKVFFSQDLSIQQLILLIRFQQLKEEGQNIFLHKDWQKVFDKLDPILQNRLKQGIFEKGWNWTKSWF